MTKENSKKTDKIINIVFYGIGGQGVLLASEICGWAAIFEGYHVKKTEVHGMAQRGGSVESHLRFGKSVLSPITPDKQVDFLVCLHAEEHERLLSILKPNGIDLIEYSRKADELLKDKKFYKNTFMLGVLSYYLPLKEGNWLKAIDFILSKKNTEENKSVFLQGRNMGDKI